MINNTPSLDLVEFIETKILPQYAQFDSAHNMEHVTRVIRRSLALVKTTGADMNMVYTIAAYHDLGMSGPRAVHHITGGKILAADVRLKKWFSPEQINIMKEAGGSQGLGKQGSEKPIRKDNSRGRQGYRRRGGYPENCAVRAEQLSAVRQRRTLETVQGAYGQQVLCQRIYQAVATEVAQREKPQRPEKPHRRQSEAA